jgi:hypothetical protein
LSSRKEKKAKICPKKKEKEKEKEKLLTHQ